MWTLECEGPQFQHKKIWLCPSKTYLFGRTQKPPVVSDVDFFIDDSKASRKHFTIQVSAVKKGEGSLVHTRSELAVTDENTRAGTFVDGDKLTAGHKRFLKSEDHSLRIGAKGSTFRIKWQPVVLSFSLSSKETRGGKDPLAAIRTQLEELDIKTITSYLVETTTHVVSSKRNTAKGLQALINAKYIVAESFVTALIYVTTPHCLDEPENFSPLEKDFDGNWPKALDYLPAKSKEPNERPAEFFKPNPERKNIFEGYTFIFCDQTQHDVLQAPVNNGGGKALYFPLEPGKTSAEELIRYVKKAAGEKSLGEFEDGSAGKGVVLVRFRGKKAYEEWAMDLGDQLALALNQRMIEQSEFMDAILSNDASILRRPLQEEDEQATDPALPSKPPQSRTIANVHENSQHEISQPPPRRTRGPIISRFKGFDSDSDDYTESGNLQNRENIQKHSTSTHGQSQPATSSVSITNPALGIPSQSTENGKTQTRNPRKRSAAPSDEDDDEEIVDKLLPAAGAMKRRKLEEQDEARRKGVVPISAASKSQTPAQPEKPRREKKEINIQEVVRERREAEENAARLDEESLRETTDGMNIREVKSLAVVEEMELRERQTRPQQNGTLDPRWNEEWNGRKNFKKFRRQGETNQARRGQTVIVPLEEVKKKDFGIGDEYWLESEKSKKKRKEKGQATQSQSQNEELSSTAKSGDREAFRDRTSDADDPAVEIVEAPRITRVKNTEKRITPKPQAPIRKRAASTAIRGPPPKKQRTPAVRDSDNDSDSDSEDELKFRFKPKR